MQQEVSECILTIRIYIGTSYWHSRGFIHFPGWLRGGIDLTYVSGIQQKYIISMDTILLYLVCSARYLGRYTGRYLYIYQVTRELPSALTAQVVKLRLIFFLFGFLNGLLLAGGEGSRDMMLKDWNCVCWETGRLRDWETKSESIIWRATKGYVVYVRCTSWLNSQKCALSFSKRQW